MAGANFRLTRTQRRAYARGKEATALCSAWVFNIASPSVKRRYGLHTAGQILSTVATTPRCRKAKISKAELVQNLKGDVGVGERKTTEQQHTLRPSLYLPLVEDILSQKPAIVVPQDVLLAFRNAIHFRKRCCSYFEHETDAEISEINERHLYFVGVLQHVYDQLLSFCQRSKSASKPSVPITCLGDASDSLELQDVHDAAFNQNPSKKRSMSADELKFVSQRAIDPFAEAETSASASKRQYQRVCAAQDLLEEAQAMHRFIRKKWMELRTDDVDIVAVGQLSSMACALLAEQEKDFTQRFHSSWTSVQVATFWQQLKKRPQSTEEGAADTDFDFHADLESCRRVVSSLYSRAELDSASTPRKTPVASDHAYLQRIEQLIQRGIDLERIDDDFSLDQTADRLLLLLRDAASLGQTSLTSAWALRVISDVPKWLGTDISAIYHVEAAKEAYFQAKQRFDERGEKDESLSDPPWFNAVGKLCRSLEPEDPVAGSSRIIQSAARRWMHTSPTTCASLASRLHICASGLAARVADSMLSIQLVLHFYNCAKQSSDLAAPWADMERLMELYGEDVLFFGRRPQTLKDCLSQYRFIAENESDLSGTFPEFRKISNKLSKVNLFPHHAPLLVHAEDVSLVADEHTSTNFHKMKLMLFSKHKTDVMEKDQMLKIRDEQKLERAFRKAQTGPIALLNMAEEKISEELQATGFDHWTLSENCAVYLSRVHSKMPGPIEDKKKFDKFLLAGVMLLLADGCDGKAKACAEQWKNAATVSKMFQSRAETSRMPYDDAVKLLNAITWERGSMIVDAMAQS